MLVTCCQEFVRGSYASMAWLYAVPSKPPTMKSRSPIRATPIASRPELIEVITVHVSDTGSYLNRKYD